MQALVDVILPVFLVIGAGYSMVWARIFSQDAADTMMNFAQRFAIPSLLFLAVYRLDLSQHFDPNLIISFYSGAIAVFALGVFGARVLFGRAWPDAVAIGFCAMFSNTVLLGLPITERAYGTDALTYNYAIVAVHSPLLYTAGFVAMGLVNGRGRGPLGLLQSVVGNILRTPLMIGVALGFVANLSGLNLPGVVTESLQLLARAALPVALFSLGAILYTYRPAGDSRAIIYVVLLSLLVHPAITYGLGNMTGLSDAALRSAVLTGAMAPGINVYIFANIYGVGKRVAASAVLIGTLANIFTAWLWIGVLP